MANRICNLTKRVMTAQGLRYCPVVLSANGRVRTDWVLVNGVEERHPEGTYCIEWREGSKRIRVSVGKDPQDAAAQRLRKEAELNAKNLGVSVVSERESDGRPTLAAAVAEFIADARLTKKPATVASYQTALDYFVQSCPKKYLAEIERRDLLRFVAFLRDEKELTAHTCAHKFTVVLIFLKANGIRGLVDKNDWPRYTQEEPEVYEREDLDKFFAACDDYERALFEFFLMTGFRDQEVMHGYWSDVNFGASTVRVTHKPNYGWTPKRYKEREVPVPAKLIQSLKALRKKANGCPLIFPNGSCRPTIYFLDICKRVAERAKLDPADWWLHKFRATFATWHLWNGVDLRTVQAWLGHSDLESTMRYLKPSRSQQVREKVNATFATTAS